MKLAAFDLETAKITPDNVRDLKQYFPLGISCAALAYSDRSTVTYWQGVPQLAKPECQKIVAALQDAVRNGYTLLTWNGCSFDFSVLAQESGLTEECGRLALEHVDLMLMVTFKKGYFLSLDKALVGASLSGKVKTLRLSDGTVLTNMSGAMAPRLWAKGECQAVLDYLRADAVQLLALAKNIDLLGRIGWTSNSGREQYVRVEELSPVKACFEFPEPDVSWMNDPPSREQFVDWIPDWRKRLIESLSSKRGGSSAAGASGNSQQRPSCFTGTTVTLDLGEDGSIVFRDDRGAPLSEEMVRQARRERKRFILLWLAENCDEHDQRIRSLLHMHTATPHPDTRITFTPEDFDVLPPSAPTNDFARPYPQPPEMREHSFLTKRVGLLGKRIDKENERLHSDYEERIKEWQQARERSEAAFQAKRHAYAAQLAEYGHEWAAHQALQERRRKLIEEDRLTDTTAMMEFLGQALKAIVWPTKTTVEFEIVDEGRTVSLAVDLPEIDGVPNSHASVNKRDLKLTFREPSKAQRLMDYATHIHAIGFRVIGEVFVALPTASTVILSAFSPRLDATTGQSSRECLYSAKIPRQDWSQINFSNLSSIDVVKCFEGFELRRIMTNGGKLSPVEPI